MRTAFLATGLGLLLGLPTPTLADGRAEWELVREEQGIQISRRIGEEPGPRYRASVVMDAGLFEILAVLADDPRRTEWMTNCIESRRLGEPEDGTQLVYSRVEGSWPVADRDAVVASRATVGERGEWARIEMRSAEDAGTPPVPGVVRMPALEGTYDLQAQGSDRTRVQYEVEMDLGGYVPGFVNHFVREELPFDTLLGLRRYVKRTHGSYTAEAEALGRGRPAVTAPPQPR